MTNVHAVIVTYHPTESVLLELIARLAGQVEHIWLIDNATPIGADLLQRLPPNIDVIVNEDNVGLASCYNSAIRRAQKVGAHYVILFDQDSLPNDQMVIQLRDALQQLNSQGLRVAAVGPAYIDVKGAKGFFVRKRCLHLQRITPNSNHRIIAVDHLISSGCCIDLDRYDAIGPFTEGLFIDYVDTEWCLRARAQGYTLFGIPAAAMRHDLGSACIRVFGRAVMLHAPMRSYYRIRNGVWLLRQPWVGWNWRIIDMIRLCKLAAAMVILPPERWQHARAMWSGLKDGMLGRMGRCSFPH